MTGRALTPRRQRSASNRARPDPAPRTLKDATLLDPASRAPFSRRIGRRGRCRSIVRARPGWSGPPLLRVVRHAQETGHCRTIVLRMEGRRAVFEGPRSGPSYKHNPYGADPVSNAPEYEKAARRRLFVTHLSGWENWSGRRDSNPRPQPWQGWGIRISHVFLSFRVFSKPLI